VGVYWGWAYTVVGNKKQKTMARFLWSVLPHVPKLLCWRQGMVREFGKGNSSGITEYGDLNIVFTSREFHPENHFVIESPNLQSPNLYFRRS